MVGAKLVGFGRADIFTHHSCAHMASNSGRFSTTVFTNPGASGKNANPMGKSTVWKLDF